MSKPSTAPLERALVSAERDTLGVDALRPRRIHAEVLDACERALSKFYTLQGQSAEAPRAPEATHKVPDATHPRTTPAAITIRQSALAAARAAVEDLAPTTSGGVGEGGGESEVDTIVEAEAAWLHPAINAIPSSRHR